jgi:hypothetical protein
MHSSGWYYTIRRSDDASLFHIVREYGDVAQSVATFYDHYTAELVCNLLNCSDSGAAQEQR